MNKKILATVGIMVVLLILIGTYSALKPKAKYPAGWMPDKPLGGDPEDLGNLHRPAISELVSEELDGISRYNWWFNFAGNGSDGKMYGIYGQFREGKGYTVVKSFPDNKELCVANFGWDSVSGKEIGKDSIVLSAQIDPKKNGDFIKYTIKNDSYTVEALCDGSNLNLFFKKDISFWYNKGNAATVYPDTKIAGIEEISSASGTITVAGETTNLNGLGVGEHVFNNGNIATKIKEYTGEYWMPFRSNEVQGIFAVFGHYKDAGLMIDGKYIIPSGFDYVLDGRNKTIRIYANTSKGKLEMTYHIFGSMGQEYPATIEGHLDGRNLTNGFGWMEHLG